MKNNAEIVECPSLEEAVMKTMMDAANCNGSVIPVVVAKQGKRTTLSGAMSVGLLEKHVQSDSAKKSASPDDLALAGNRPLLPEHVDAIAKYLITNAGAAENGKGTYILPPITLCVKDPIRVYVPRFSSTPTTMGYAVLPAASKVGTTDGQHRGAGIGKARSNMGTADSEAFERDSVTFMLTLEDDIEQAHQDFADCSKTKAIPPSMLAVYDRRVPANKLVVELTRRCPVFVEKIDSTSKSLGKHSTCLFTANQVRQLVKSLLTGDMAMSETAFVERVNRTAIPDDDPATLEDVVNRCVDYINLLTECVPAWKEAAAITKRGPAMNRIKHLRQTSPSLLYTATGLNIIGCVGYDIFDRHKDEWRLLTERLGKLNFDKDHSLWSDVLVTKVNKAGEKVFNISTNRGPVERAVAKARQAIGLDPEPTPEQPRSTSPGDKEAIEFKL